MGLLIEKYIGKTGRKLFLLFSWLFCGLVIAAFADMVAGTFNAYDAEGALAAAATTNGAAGSISCSSSPLPCCSASCSAVCT